MALSLTSLSLSLARSAEPEPEPDEASYLVLTYLLPYLLTYLNLLTYLLTHLTQALYAAFNEAGEALGSEAALQAIVEETRAAFAHNVGLYSEEGRLWSGAARGVGNMVGGFARAKLLG